MVFYVRQTDIAFWKKLSFPHINPVILFFAISSLYNQEDHGKNKKSKEAIEHPHNIL